LYDAILKMSNSWQRERCIVIREAIDQTYNKIVCRSVNSGTGLFSVSSMKGSHTHEELADSLRTIEVDECTTSEILCAPLHYFSGAADCLSKALDWSDVEAFVSDPACRVRAAALQRALCSSDPSMRQDMLAAHHEFLSDRLSNKVWTAPCQRGTVLNLLVDCAAPGLQAIVGGALGFLIGGPIGSAAGAGIAAGLPIPLGIQWTEKLHGEIQGGVLRGFTRRALARSVT
jgi:hypothetical protein